MLDLFDQNPASRVFHVDRECYVIYLGSHWDDYRPFLRIGTSAHLPAGLPPIVSSIVVSDTLTGNPLEEMASLSGDAKPGTHYVGDADTVERLKDYLDLKKIKVSPLTEADHEEEDSKHVIVYYYKDGNLKLKFKKSEILDLRRRERQDGHFVARAQEAKNEYGRSPFKLPSVYYQQSGFVARSSSVYILARGDLGALSLSPDYFFDLCSAGIDADRVSTVWVDDTNEALINFFKRSRAKERPVHVATPHPESVDAAIGLFGANSQSALDATTLSGHGGAFEFHGMKITQSPGRFEVHNDSFPGPLIVGQGTKTQAENAIHVDPKAGRVSIGGQTTLSMPLIDGALFTFPHETLTRTLIQERYLPEKNYPYREMLSQPENMLFAHLDYCFNDLFSGRDPSKVIRNIRNLSVIRALSSPGSDELHPLTRLLLFNYRSFIGFLKASEPELAAKVDSLDSLLGRLSIDPRMIPASLPLVAEVFVKDDQPHGFIRFASRVTGERYGHAERIAESIVAVPSIDYEAERSRLADLIAGLATPEQMDEARMRRIAEAKKKPTTTTRPPETEGSARPEVARTGTKGRANPISRRPPSRGGRGGWIAAAAVVIVVLLAALLFFGVIPNPWFGQDQSGAVAAGDTGTSTGQSADGTDTSVSGDGSDTTIGSDATTGSDSETGGVDQGTSSDTSSTGTSESGTDQSGTTSSGQETPLPEGWPEETRPAIEALQEIPGVTIMADRVVGPGGIEISVLDIIALVNAIAVDNGYARMDEPSSDLPDPDWIYPENVFVLPNEARYTVVEGDTLWGITVRYMVARLQQDLGLLESLSEEYQASGTTAARKTEIIARLERLASESHVENFTRLVQTRLAEFGE